MRAVASATVVCLTLLSCVAGPAPAELRVDVEGGAAFSAYNDVRIPGDSGTRFSLTDDLETDPASVFRARIEYTFGERHTLSALWAPLTATASGRADRPIVFTDEKLSA